ncbi:MAG: hypothetical protein JW720_04955 [Sedimentisphaerales bacterium]|nr:hypothetical protein [Sedimentisphaerales bacterium]
MNNENVMAAVLNRAQESEGKKRLNCAEAFKLAAELNVGVAEIGRICNQCDVRICKCQLGCFS